MERPADVPSEAVWIAADDEWELGEKRAGKNVGVFTWWRRDGTRACQSTFDDDGELHGVAQRWHPNGEPSLIAPYVHGKLHGKQIATLPSSGDSPEMRELRALDAVFRSELLHLGGVAQKGVVTLYGRTGLFDPIASDAEGRSPTLGDELDKVRPGTALVLLAPFLASLGGKVPASKVRGLHYLCAAIEGGAIHRVAVEGRRGETTIAIVPRDAFVDLALAVEHAVARLSSAPAT